MDWKIVCGDVLLHIIYRVPLSRLSKQCLFQAIQWPEVYLLINLFYIFTF